MSSRDRRMEDAVMEWLKGNERKKAEEMVEPGYSLLTEVLRGMDGCDGRMVRDALNGLHNDRRIIVGHTLNDQWIFVAGGWSDGEE